jgi:hypothetical protein
MCIQAVRHARTHNLNLLANVLRVDERGENVSKNKN